MAFGYAVLYYIGRAQAIRVDSGGYVAGDTKVSHNTSVDTTSRDRDGAWRDEFERKEVKAWWAIGVIVLNIVMILTGILLLFPG